MENALTFDISHIVTNHLLHFLALDRSDPKKFQILQLIAALLGWDDGECSPIHICTRKPPTNADSRTTRTGRPCTTWHLKYWKTSSTRDTSPYPQHAKSSHRIHGQRRIKQRNPRRIMVKLPRTGSRGWQDQLNATRKSSRPAVPMK